MSLQTLLKVRKLQAALHAKAKGAPSYRFYALYDEVYRAGVLEEAYERCRENGGAAGVDGQTFEDIENYGVQMWLGELAQEFRGVPELGLPNPRLNCAAPGRLSSSTRLARAVNGRVIAPATRRVD